jgi:hypothetical protein
VPRKSLPLAASERPCRNLQGRFAMAIRRALVAKSVNVLKDLYKLIIVRVSRPAGAGNGSKAAGQRHITKVAPACADRQRQAKT